MGGRAAVERRRAPETAAVESAACRGPPSFRRPAPGCSPRPRCWPCPTLRCVWRPGRPGWTRLVGGATPAGAVPEGALVSLPGLDRAGRTLLVVEAEAAAGAPATLGVAVDGGPLQWVRTGGAVPAAVVLPAARAPGARIALRRSPGSAAPRLVSLRVDRDARRRRPGWPQGSAPWPPPRGRGPGLTAGARGRVRAGARRGVAVALAFTPALLWLTLPGAPALARLAVPALLLAAAALLAARLPAPRRRGAAYRRPRSRRRSCSGPGCAPGSCPPPGSWDTEYWKGWTARMRAPRHHARVRRAGAVRAGPLRGADARAGAPGHRRHRA